MPRERTGDSRGGRWQWLKDAFSTESDFGPITDREVDLLDRIAKFVVRRGMTTPAILFLESVKPMNYLGSQVMAFFEPVVKILFSGQDYGELQQILERRESIEVLIQRIELADATGRSPESSDSGDGGDKPSESADSQSDSEVHENR